MSDLSGLLLGYYGDDFTGSTDALEAMTCAGVRSVLFLEPPRPEQMARFPGAQVVGVAGVSRSLPTEAMEGELRPVFTALRALGAPLVHYKVCSTFDSSPAVGSIGRAIEIGQEVFASPFVPLIVGAPVLGRYCVFGNLFARSGLDTEPSRLDRHPTMRHHPVTPMDEADLRLHLARQTPKRIGLFDILRVALPKDDADAQFADLLATGPEVVLFDILYPEHLPAIGRLLWDRARREQPIFAAGSSGVEYALTAHWKAAGLLPEVPPVPPAEPVEQIIAVSGSCSPVTERQIAWALENGFAEVPMDAARLLATAAGEAECRAAVEKATDILAAGRSVIVHTCRGPEDGRLQTSVKSLRSHGAGGRMGKTLGTALGRILHALLKETGLRRAAVCGGDTSSYVARALGIEALEMAAPMAPGSPLCRVHATDPSVDGVEMVFKGGQVGKTDFFGVIRSGRP